jgi:hypothetical protein
LSLFSRVLVKSLLYCFLILVTTRVFLWDYKDPILYRGRFRLKEALRSGPKPSLALSRFLGAGL